MFLIILPLSRQTTAQSDGRLSFLSTEYLCVVCFLKKYQPPQDSCLRNVSSYLTMISQSFFFLHYMLGCGRCEHDFRQKYLSVLECGLRFYICGYIPRNRRFRYTKSGICNFRHFATKTQYVVFRKKVSRIIL